MTNTVWGIKITSGDGTSQVVDMTNRGENVDIDIKNPIAVIALPTNSGNATAYSNFNTVTVNIKMLNVYINVSFTSKDGFGDDPYNFSSVTSSSTIFKQLSYLASIDATKKRLYLNSASNYLYCQILDYDASTSGGKKDIITHTLQLVVVGGNAQ